MPKPVYLMTVQEAHKEYNSLMDKICRAMMTKGMVFRYTWVYSKEDTMAHTCRLMVIS